MSNDTAAAAPPEVSIQDVQQQVLAAIKIAVVRDELDGAQRLAETYETLVRAETMEHHAVRAHVERALRQLAEANATARGAASPNAAVPPGALETGGGR